MGLAENLAEAFAQSTGATGAANAIENKKSDRAATAHEELAANTQAILNDITAIQKRRMALDPKSPTYQKDLAGVDADLDKARQTFHDLYHPAKNPGALNHLGGFLRAHLGGKRPIPATPGQAKQSLADTMAQLDAGAATPVAQPAAQSTPNPILVRRQQMKDAGYSDEDIAKAEHRTLPTAPGAPAPTTKQTSDERARQDFTDFKKDYKEKHKKDYPFTFEYWKTHEAAQGRASVPRPAAPPKPPGAAKLTPAQNAAQRDYVQAYSISDFGDRVAKHPDDAANQKRFAVALERVSAGRFTQQAVDYITKQAGWGNTIEQWANSPTTGALPADIMRQLIAGAHEWTDSKKAELDLANSLAPQIPATPKQAKDLVNPPRPTSTNKQVSLAAAKKLPAMQGKSDDEIRKLIEAQGHTVVP